MGPPPPPSTPGSKGGGQMVPVNNSPKGKGKFTPPGTPGSSPYKGPGTPTTPPGKGGPGRPSIPSPPGGLTAKGKGGGFGGNSGYGGGGGNDSDGPFNNNNNNNFNDRVPLKEGSAPSTGPFGSGGRGGVGGGGRKIRPGARLAALKYLGPRAIVQIFLTVLCVGSSLVCFIFSVIFNASITTNLMENMDGQLKSPILPCIREILNHPICQMDLCYDRCCPPGYMCMRSPTVGLYCQDGNNICGGGDVSKGQWCSDYADIPGNCLTETCLKRDLVHSLTVPVYSVTGLGLFLDLVDLVIFFAAPDQVQFKSSVNLLSSMIKWIAFGLMLGGGTQSFVADLYDNQCYNNAGMTAVRDSGQYLVSFVTTIVISALLSLILAPISAYYGGKLIGVPYVK